MFDVVTIGSATRDVFVRSPLFRVVRDPKHLEKLGFPTGEAECFALGAKIEIEKPVFAVGGGAANAAVTFARQGFRTAALVKVGKDYVGAQAILALKKEKVMPLAIRDRHGLGTSWSAILLSPGGERTILNYRGASEKISKSEIRNPKLKAKWAYIAPGHISFEVIRAVVERLKKSGTRVAMNPSKHYLAMGERKLAPLLRTLDVILVNREEGAYLTGYRYAEEKKIFRKFDKLVPGIAVMTDGPRGVLVSDGKRIYRAGIFREKKMADRTGAGDAFGSGFVAGLMGQLPATSYQLPARGAIEYAIRLGSANATSVVEAIGAQEGILRKREFEQAARFRTLGISKKLL
ncbi:MAG: carbohydrate kinase family protein [Candidatus Liptonbacteria bacterium]|nr:carbohydrate kinase family protein [Candidatus Liptonbacteria bacterium]